MKILFISMHSVHAVRWIENLKDTPFELYWYDVTDRGKLQTTANITQFTGLKTRKRKHIKGEFLLSKKFPTIYEYLRTFLEVTENEALEKIIKEVNPDIIHSFEMQACSYPIVKTMRLFPDIKWIYSCWGNDLFYFRNYPSHLRRIKNVLDRVDILHTDCQRDYKIAKELGFNGIHTGVIPGGSGYDIDFFKKYRRPWENRKIILIKGYQHIFGRALNVVKAIEKIYNQLEGYEIVVFGSHKPVIDYISLKNLPFTVYSRNELQQKDLISLMGKSLIYIGNSNTDGIPNTLLEAILMGAFPIQSNPGNVTSEVITDRNNGMLIENPDDVEKIREVILDALSDKERLRSAAIHNYKWAEENLGYEYNKAKIIEIYKNANRH